MLGNSATYQALLGAALQGAVWGVAGGPNCRSRSVLRRYPGSHDLFEAGMVGSTDPMTCPRSSSWFGKTTFFSGG